MTIEDKLKGFIVANYGSVKNFSEYTNVPYQTIVSILLRGIQSGKFGNIQNICNVLGISMDELSKGNIDSYPIVSFDNFDPQYRKRDLATIIRQYARFAKREGVMLLDKEPLTEEERTFLLDSLNVIMEIMRHRRKKANLEKNIENINEEEK